MEYTIYKESKFKKLFKKIKSKAEDIFISVVAFIAKYTKSKRLNNWLSKYTQKRIAQIKQEMSKTLWNKQALDRANRSIDREKATLDTAEKQ